MWPPNVPSKATFSFVHLLQALQLSKVLATGRLWQMKIIWRWAERFCFVLWFLLWSPVSPRRRFFLPRGCVFCFGTFCPFSIFPFWKLRSTVCGGKKRQDEMKGHVHCYVHNPYPHLIHLAHLLQSFSSVVWRWTSPEIELTAIAFILFFVFLLHNLIGYFPASETGESSGFLSKSTPGCKVSFTLSFTSCHDLGWSL